MKTLKEEDIEELTNGRATAASGDNHGVQELPFDRKKSGCILKPVGAITLTKYKIIKSSEGLNLSILGNFEKMLSCRIKN